METYKCPYCDNFETHSFAALGRHVQAIHHLRITKEIYNKLMAKKKTPQPIETKETPKPKEIPVEEVPTPEEEVPVKKDKEQKEVSWFGHHTM